MDAAHTATGAMKDHSWLGWVGGGAFSQRAGKPSWSVQGGFWSTDGNIENEGPSDTLTSAYEAFLALSLRTTIKSSPCCQDSQPGSALSAACFAYRCGASSLATSACFYLAHKLPRRLLLFVFDDDAVVAAAAAVIR